MFTKTRSTTRRSRFTTPTSRARTFKRVEARKTARPSIPKVALGTPVAAVELPAEITPPAGEVATVELTHEKPARKPRAPRKVAAPAASKPVSKKASVKRSTLPAGPSLEDLAARLKANKEAARAIRAANKSSAPKTSAPKSRRAA